MKILDDKKIKIQKPTLSTGSYSGADILLISSEYKLTKINEYTNPPKIGLIFNAGERQKICFIEPIDKYDDVYIRGYKNELENKLNGRAWDEIKNHDFTFNEASRISN